MKTTSKYLLSIFMSFLFMFSLFACGNTGGISPSSNTYSQNPDGASSTRLETISQNPLIGTWKNGEHNLTIKSDKAYMRDVNPEGVASAWGHFLISGNVIIVTDSDGHKSCDDEAGSGSYTYTITNNSLTFSLVHDTCSSRVDSFGLTYVKQ
jgi:hypothetical protein